MLREMEIKRAVDGQEDSTKDRKMGKSYRRLVSLFITPHMPSVQQQQVYSNCKITLVTNLTRNKLKIHTVAGHPK